jgi:uncharacterized protein YndB with AHSA1/START domain
MNERRQKAITIERVYPASNRELWELWTTPDGFESWWGPQGFRVAVHNLEAKLGGVLHYTMMAATAETIRAMKDMGQAEAHEVRSSFSHFEPETALSLASVIDFLPGVEAYESLIEVRFSALGKKTKMTVVLYAMHNPDFTEMQKEGFSSQLTKLDERYGGPGA